MNANALPDSPAPQRAVRTPATRRRLDAAPEPAARTDAAPRTPSGRPAPGDWSASDVVVHDGPPPPLLKPAPPGRLAAVADLIGTLTPGQWFVVPGSASLGLAERKRLGNTLRKSCERRGTAISIRTTADGAIVVIRGETGPR